METDYSKIASRYDRNKVRRKDVDHHIKTLLESGHEQYRILDLACGTGKYLKIQTEYYNQPSIQWLGADRSGDMLKIAEKKGINADFFCCNAEDPSIASDGTVDYIRNEYAWHHFTTPEKVIRNIHRMLKPGGLFVMINICPEYMKDYWVHRYFPGTRDIDRKRFKSPELLLKSFRELDFDVKIKIKTIVNELKLKSILEEAENRDISQLTLIDDHEYAEGLKLIKADIENRKAVIHDMSFIELSAYKKNQG